MEFQISDDEYTGIQQRLMEQLAAQGVSPIYIDELQELYEDENTSQDDLVSIELRIIGQLFADSSTGFNLQNSNGKIYAYIKKEIYELICENSEKYSPERAKFTEYLEKLIPLISASAAAFFNASATIFVGVVSMILISVLKVGRNAWCSMQKDLLDTGAE